MPKRPPYFQPRPDPLQIQLPQETPLTITLQFYPTNGQLVVTANAPIQPFQMCDILLKVIQENIAAYNKQASLLIDKNKLTLPEEPPTDEPSNQEPN